MACSYEPGCSSSIFSFSLSVKITGCLLLFHAQSREYPLNFPSDSVRNSAGSFSYIALKNGLGSAIFIPVISESIISFPLI